MSFLRNETTRLKVNLKLVSTENTDNTDNTDVSAGKVEVL